MDRRVTNNGYNGQTERHTARFLAVCEAIKAKGIHIWVVAFAVEGGITDALKKCANSESAFTASNASELDEAFQDIAKEVGELRIVQ
jgi:aspartokinase